MSAPVGLISNPQSHGVSRRGSLLETIASKRTDAHFARLDDFTAAPRLVSAFAKQGVSAIFVEGGDGTLRAVLSACLAANPGHENLPRIAVLPGGSTNTAYKALGVRNARLSAVRGMIERISRGRTAEQQVRQRALVVRNAAMSAPLAGFLLSTGSAARAMIFCQREVHAGGLRGSLAVAATVARLIAAPRTTPDSDGKSLLRASEFSASVNGRSYDGEHAFTLMTTLSRLNLGLNPFWGEGGGAIALTHARWPVRGVRRAALKALTGRKGAALEKHGLSSVRADGLTFHHHGPAALDGELIAIPDDGVFHVSASPVFTFLR